MLMPIEATQNRLKITSTANTIIFDTNNKMPHIINSGFYNNSGNAINVIANINQHYNFSSSGLYRIFSADTIHDIDLGFTAPIQCDFLVGTLKIVNVVQLGSFYTHKANILLPINKKLTLNGSTLLQFLQYTYQENVGGYTAIVFKWPYITTVQLIQKTDNKIYLRFRCSTTYTTFQDPFTGNTTGVSNHLQTILKLEVQCYWGKIT